MPTSFHVVLQYHPLGSNYPSSAQGTEALLLRTSTVLSSVVYPSSCPCLFFLLRCLAEVVTSQHENEPTVRVTTN